MKRWVIAAVAAGAIGTGAVQWYLKPMVLEAAPEMLHAAVAENVNGDVAYRQLDISWNGDAVADGLIVRDTQGKTVATIDRVRVSWSLWRLLEYVAGQRQAVGVIDGITLQRPEVFLREDPDKSWNVTKLIKKKETDTPMALRAKILVNGGEAHLDFQNEPDLRITDISAMVDLNDYPAVLGDVRAKYLDAPLHVKGTYRTADDFRADIEAAQLPLVLLSRFVPQTEPALEIQGGYLRQVEGHVENHGQGMTYRASGDLVEGKLRYDRYQVNKAGAKWRVETKRVSFYDANLEVNDQSLQGQGIIQLGGVEPVLDLDIATKGTEVRRLVDIPLEGKVAAQVHIGGTLSDWFAEGVAMLPQGKWENTNLQQVFAQFVYRDHILRLPKWDIGIEKGRAFGSAYYNLKTEAGEADFTARQIDLSALPMVSGLTGVAEASGFVKIAKGAVESASVLAEGNGIGANGVWTDTLRASVEADHGQWQINYLNGTMGDGAFTAYGRLNESEGLALRADNIPLQRLQAATGLDMHGAASWSGRVYGPPEHLQAEGEFSARDGAVRGMPFTTLHGEVAYRNDALALHDVHWLDTNGGHRIDGTVHLTGDKAVDLQVHTEHVRVEDVLKLADASIPLTGWMDNQLEVKGSLSAPQVTGKVTLWDGSVMGELYQHLTAGYRYEDNTFYVDDAIGNMYDATIHARGFIQPDYFKMDVEAVGIDIDRVLRENNTFDLQGSVDARGVAEGNPKNPRFEGHINGTDVRANGEYVDELQADIMYDNKTVLLQNAFFRQNDGVYEFNGGYSLENGRIFGEGKVTKADLGRLLNLLRINAPHIQGTLAGKVRLDGTTENPSVTVQGRLENGRVRDKEIGVTDLDLDYANRVITIRKLRMPLGAGFLAAQGKADLNGQLDMQVAAKDIDVSYLPAFADTELALTGNLSFSGVLRGQTDNPEMDMSFALNNGVYNGMAFDRFIGLLNMKDNVIHVNQALLQREPYQVSLYGTIPVKALTKKGRAEAGAESMHMEMRLDKADLDLFTGFVPALKSASGALKGGVVVTGTLDDPSVQGRIHLDQGQMVIETMKNPVEDMRAEINFRGKSADWNMDLGLGKGRIDSHGKVHWTGLSDLHYNGEINLRGANPKSTYYDGELNGQVQLADYLGRPLISGHLDLENVKLDLPLTLSSEEGGEPIYFDFDVHLGDKVRLYNSYLYDMYLKGDIHAGGSTVSPEMKGKVTVVRGQLKYLNNKFKIQEGTADFNRSGTFLPNLHVSAMSRFNEYKIQMNADGLPTNLDLKLTSEPSLTQEEIIMMLTLHTKGKIEDLGKKDANVVLNAAAQALVFGALESRLQDTLGLDMINITTGSIDPFETTTAANKSFYNLEIGKYLFDDFMLVLTTGVNNEQQSIGIRYDINPQFTVNAWANNENNYYIGGNWQKKF